MHKFFAALVGLVLLALPAWSEVIVTGSGQVAVKPDVAQVSLGVVTTDKTASKALTDNNAAMKKLFNNLKENGVKSECIHTSDFSIQAVYDTRKNADQNTIIGYRVNNTVTVKTSNLDKFGELLDLLVQEGANNVTGVRFTVDNQDDLLDDARQKAMKQARQRAKLYAEAGDFKLGKVLKVMESHSHYPQIYSMSTARNMAAESAVPVSGGQLNFSVTVTVTFDIEGSPKKKTPAAEEPEE